MPDQHILWLSPFEKIFLIHQSPAFTKRILFSLKNENIVQFSGTRISIFIRVYHDYFETVRKERNFYLWENSTKENKCTCPYLLLLPHHQLHLFEANISYKKRHDLLHIFVFYFDSCTKRNMVFSSVCYLVIRSCWYKSKNNIYIY